MAACMLKSQTLIKFRFCRIGFTRNKHFSQKWSFGNSIKRTLGTPYNDSDKWHLVHQNIRRDDPTYNAISSVHSDLGLNLSVISDDTNRNKNSSVYFSRSFKPPSPCSGDICLKSRNGSNINLFQMQRNYSDDQRTDKVPLRLMDFPEIVWPSAIKSLKNWILANLIITPYFDRDFSLPEFIKGSKKAVEVASELISQNDYDHLDGLVTPTAAREVQRNIAAFSMKQRQELRIVQDDIYFCFPYQVGVMLSDNDDNPKRYVEITMCYHTLQGLDDMRNQGKTPPINMGMMPEYRDKIYICNYRFIREYTKGVEDQWTINIINHFKPADYIA